MEQLPGIALTSRAFQKQTPLEESSSYGPAVPSSQLLLVACVQEGEPSIVYCMVLFSATLLDCRCTGITVSVLNRVDDATSETAHALQRETGDLVIRDCRRTHLSHAARRDGTSSDGTIGESELCQLVKAVDKASFWDEAKLASLMKGFGLDAGRIKLKSFAQMLFEGPQSALYQVVREDLRKAMTAPEWDDGSYAPILIRLAWHSSGTYNKADGTGGSNGATMRHALEANDPENAYLEHARELLEAVKAKHSWISYADLWILASYVALENTNGPRPKAAAQFQCDVGAETKSLKEYSGANDWVVQCECMKCVSIDLKVHSTIKVAPGRLPGAEHGLADGMEGWENLAQHIRDVFGRMGITDREAVALICGGHVYGRCHPEPTASGYAGAWVEMPTLFSNEYAADMVCPAWSCSACLCSITLVLIATRNAAPATAVFHLGVSGSKHGSAVCHFGSKIYTDHLPMLIHVTQDVSAASQRYLTAWQKARGKGLNDYGRFGVLSEVQAYNRQSTELIHRELCQLKQTGNLTALFIQAGVLQKLGDDSCFVPPMRERYALHLERNGVAWQNFSTLCNVTFSGQYANVLHSPALPNPYGLLIVQHSTLRVCPIETRMPRGEGPLDQDYANDAYHRCKEGLDVTSNCSELLEIRNAIFAKRSDAVRQRFAEWFSVNPGTVVAVLHPEFEKLDKWPSGVGVFRFLPTQGLEGHCQSRRQDALSLLADYHYRSQPRSHTTDTMASRAEAGREKLRILTPTPTVRSCTVSMAFAEGSSSLRVPRCPTMSHANFPLLDLSIRWPKMVSVGALNLAESGKVDSLWETASVCFVGWEVTEVGDRWIAVKHDTVMPDGGQVPEEVRPAPGKRQYIDLTKYEGEAEHEIHCLMKARIELASGIGKEQPDVSSPVHGRAQDTSLTAFVGRGGWISLASGAGRDSSLYS
ncbi:unnamed protein product [Symbiodinium natans]|uniref:Plant heme peroxidase family profile domain-containing protein n=1 Tax=Symbiodinium natans TaxID=878477 RepID=A0A812IF35_9DINO|nr:unnamed protein product [Symbiodinium natans]